MQERIDAVLDVATDFEFFDSANVVQMAALDARLNQNYFVGIAAERIEQKQVDYLYGRSVWEGVACLGAARLMARQTGVRRKREYRSGYDRSGT